MKDAIFLSASVPDPVQGPQYCATADAVAITAAVSALIYVVIGRRLLVWGGQPAVTPMIWAIADGLNTNYGEWVRLYQSRHFEDEFPEDNQRFQNVTYTDDVEHDRDRSLALMRERMFSDFNYTAAIFIGGMGGIVQEFELLQKLQPNARLLPVISTGGGTLDIAKQIGSLAADLNDDMDYVALFHRYLEIPVKERRYGHPGDQPVSMADRLARPPRQKRR
ncbi:MAG TPA: hypothetical protein VM659_13085 [Dongiaceae bacterium]|nr:hypothetical protein [Dongiaceae bacterium]